MITGYTNDLPSDCLLDTGVLFKGAVAFATTNGGLKFDPKRTTRQIQFDGMRAPIAGNDRTTSWDPTIAGTILQFNDTQIANFEADVESASASGVITFTPGRAGVLFSAGAYITDLRLIYERAGSTQDSPLYAAAYFPKALCEKYSLDGKDKDEVQIACEFHARLDMSVEGTQINDPPYKVELRTSLPA